MAQSRNASRSPNFRLPSSDPPPIYRVDLSLPPGLRYNEICSDYKAQLKQLVHIYTRILMLLPSPRFFDFLARKLLRHVRSSEETEEIRGIAKATGMDLHLVIAYNTFLDLFSGCISGGAKVGDTGDSGESTGIVHFRGLDWEMAPLRKLMICVEYVRDGNIVARTVTYAGYVGVLTGVRSGLSISYNYRMRVNSSSSMFSHRFHQLSMLLGFRRSMSSYLRKILLSGDDAPSLTALEAYISGLKASPCYLTFCSPASILIFEKDLKSVVVRRSDDFLAVTNHDQAMETLSPSAMRSTLLKGGLFHARPFLYHSMDRKRCIGELYKGATPTELGVETVQRWLGTPPLVNDSTHFSCIMDPSMEGGGLVWVQAFERPISLMNRRASESL